MAEYIRGCLYSAPSSTIDKAIKAGNLLGWRAIHDIKFRNQPPSAVSCEGHLKQEKQNLQSTKSTPTTDTPKVNQTPFDLQDIFPDKIDTKTNSLWLL